MQGTLSIRLSKQEKATLEKLALLNGMSVTKFVRSKIFDVENVPVHQKKDVQNEEMYKLITTFVLMNNSILRNAFKEKFTEEELKRIMENAEQIWKQICNR